MTHTMTDRKRKEGRRICKCECGGEVRGIESFGRMFSWCEKCTPVVTFNPHGECGNREEQTDVS